MTRWTRLHVRLDLDLGLLVAAAGFGTSGRFVEAQFQREADALAVNCRAVLGLGLHVARRLVTRGRGGLVLMSSESLLLRTRASESLLMAEF